MCLLDRGSAGQAGADVLGGADDSRLVGAEKFASEGVAVRRGGQVESVGGWRTLFFAEGGTATRNYIKKNQKPGAGQLPKQESKKIPILTS